MDRRVVQPDDERPARPDGTCFYCHQPVGGQHSYECVAYKKLVRIRATIEYTAEVPHGWDAAMIEFHRNQGSWCADSVVGDLERVIDWMGENDSLETCGMNGCLCGYAKFEYVGQEDDAAFRKAPFWCWERE